MPFPVVGRCCNHLMTLFGLAMVESPADEAKRSMVRLVSDAIEWQGWKVSRHVFVSRVMGGSSTSQMGGNGGSTIPAGEVRGRGRNMQLN